MDGLCILLSAVLSFVVSALTGRKLIPFLHKLKYGQTILDIGPSWHKNKQGTPTMGGIMFIISSVVSTAIFIPLYYFLEANPFINLVEPTLITIKIVAGIAMAVLYGLVGFLDDYIKISKKRNLGLTAKQKLIAQFLIAAGYLYSTYLAGAKSATIMPFVGEIDLGIAYWIISAIVIVGIVNAVNLTDGIDGLNGSVTFFVSVFLMTLASFVGVTGVSIASAALAGGLLGYLVWNFYPAKVFMGDTGSLFIGGFICALAYAINMPILLILLGLIYIIEMLSVVLQVTYFKLTHGKRLFKMSPIHHHFELCGWNEIKICIVFSLFTVFCGIISLVLVMFGV